LAAGPDISTHLSDVYAELQEYELMTGTFLNYYTPEGHGGVLVGYPYRSGPDFYYLRRPQEVWHHGEALITTNAWTDGTYTPADENFGADAYYDDESPKTLESHWDLLANSGNGLHQLSVAYRGRGDMTIWADGRLTGGNRTPRLEWEWTQLFGLGDLDGDGDVDLTDLTTLLTKYGTSSGATYHEGDLDGDGDVDLSDLTTRRANYGAGTGSTGCEAARSAAISTGGHLVARLHGAARAGNVARRRPAENAHESDEKPADPGRRGSRPDAVRLCCRAAGPRG
jgi:hypothetical protein